MLDSFEDYGKKMRVDFISMVSQEGEEHQKRVEGIYLKRGYKPGEHHYIKEIR